MPAAALSLPMRFLGIVIAAWFMCGVIAAVMNFGFALVRMLALGPVSLINFL